MGEETVSGMYSRLFRLPRLDRIILFGIFSILLIDFPIVFGFSQLYGVAVLKLTLLGNLLIVFGVLFAAFLVSSALSTRITMRKVSKVMNLRRTLGVSLFSLIFTTVVFLIGWILYMAFSIPLLVEFFVFALVAGFTVRLLVGFIVFSGHPVNTMVDSLSQPLIESLLFLCFFETTWFLNFLLRLFIVTSIFAIFTFIYVKAVGSQLKRVTGIDGRVFFRSFLSEWSAGVGDELEDIIDKNSVEKDLRIASLSFRNRKDEMKAIIVVPTVHPGPFKGIGSSNLPAYLMRRLEEDFGCPVLCAHGTSTHGENLVRSSQCKEVYKTISEALRGNCVPNPLSSPIVKVTEAEASVACQIFGDFALLIGSSSSLPMDDISLDVGERAVAGAKKYVKEAFFIDSHNCIDPDSDYVWPGSRAGELFVKAAQRAAKTASKFDKTKFKVGAGRIRSTGISKADGMGEEGVTAVVVQVAESSILYVLFDSNNLVANLRDVLFKGLGKIGFDAVEVLTSDTHSTSALSPGKMGYNPLGFSTPHDKILQTAVSATNLALENIEEASVCANIQVVRGVKVAGEENMQNILKGVRNSLKVSKRLAPVSFGLAILLGITIMFLL